MSANREPESDGNLDKVLKTWMVQAALPPRFQEQVWQRIGKLENRAEQTTTLWTLLRSFLETNLPRPRFAYSYVGVLLLLGIISGAWAAQHESTRLNAALGFSYVQSVDPYQRIGFNQ